MDKHGRRLTIGVGAAIGTLGAVLQAASYQYTVPLARFFSRV